MDIIARSRRRKYFRRFALGYQQLNGPSRERVPKGEEPRCQ
jgi:hypothetical protein